MAKMGRPKAESPKTKNINFRLTEEEYRRLTEYAAKHRQTITQVIYKGIALLYKTPETYCKDS